MFLGGCDGGCSLTVGFILKAVTANSEDYSPSSGLIQFTRENNEDFTEATTTLTINDTVLNKQRY